MRREWGTTLVVAALVVLSGCAALGGGTATPGGAATDGGEPTADATPTASATPSDESVEATPDGSAASPTPAATRTETATQTPMPTLTPRTGSTPAGRQSLPPGVDETGAVNETRLLVAHVEATNESNWRLRHRNGNDTRVLVHAEGATYERTADGVTWYRDGVEVTNRTFFGAPYEMSAAHNTTTGSTDPRGTITFALAVRLSSANYEWEGTTDVDGRTLHELRMTGSRGAGSALGHYTGRLLVDDDGRIHRLRGEVGENESVAEAYGYEYEWGVETAPRPPWLDSVPRGVAEKTPAGTALNVTLTSGAAVPAGTEFEFRHNDTDATVTLEESLDRGESLFVGLREEGGERSVVVSRDPLDGEGLVDLRGEQTRLSGTATVDGTEVRLSFRVGWAGI
ncbi:hypothetical protein [Halosimplex sp. J119]